MVCGTDGKTYSNECRLRKEACRMMRDIKILHDGRCDGIVFMSNLIALLSYQHSKIIGLLTNISLIDHSCVIIPYHFCEIIYLLILFTIQLNDWQ